MPSIKSLQADIENIETRLEEKQDELKWIKYKQMQVQNSISREKEKLLKKKRELEALKANRRTSLL